MANLPLGSLTLDLIANTQKLAEGLNRAEAQMSRFHQRVDSAVNAFTKFAGAYLTIQGLTTAIQTLYNSFARADAISEVADQVGFTVEQLQRLQVLGMSAGIDTGAMEQAMGRLTTAIGQAAAGSEDAQKKFVEMGVSFRDAAGNVREPMAVFEDIARKVAEAETATEALRIASEAFGERGGRRMVPLLREIADGSAETAEEMRRLGLIMSEDLIEKSGEAARAFERFGRALTVVFDSILARLGPTLVAILDFFTRVLAETAKFFGFIERSPSELLQRAERDMGAWREAIERTQGAMQQQEERIRESEASLAELGDRADATQRRMYSARIEGAQAELNFLRTQLNADREALSEAERRAEELRLRFPTPPSIDTGGQDPAHDIRLRTEREEAERAERRRREEAERRARTAAQRAENQAEQERNRLLQEAQRLYEQARTPLAEYEDSMRRIAELVERSAFTPDQQGMVAAFAAAGQAAEEFSRKYQDSVGGTLNVISLVQERVNALAEHFRARGADASEIAILTIQAVERARRPFLDFARTVYENTREPMEEFARTAQRIRDAFEGGGFAGLGGGETAMRGLAEAAGQAAAAIDQMGGDTEPAFRALRNQITALAQDMLRAGQLTEDQFPGFIERGMQKAAEEMRNSPYQLQVRAIQQATDTIMSDIENAFLDMSGNVMDTIENLLSSILRAFQRMAFRIFLEPAIATMLKAFGGVLQNMLPTPGVAGAAHGLAFANHRVIPFASGGVVSRPTLFPLGAIAEAGRPEVIAPLFRASNGDMGVKAMVGASPVTVNVYNNSDAGVRTESRDGPNGREIDLYIERAVDRGISDGRFDRALGSAFGVRRTGVR